MFRMGPWPSTVRGIKYPDLLSGMVLPYIVPYLLGPGL